ncbi:MULTISPECIES: 6-phosphogluconolactonase [unclassified Ornithinimicrobium]|uniref:6-phosphogluconolactonase n=1 Tax=unclassified Ornithinimicrobium TaxID=2615080 RepID=UPI003852173D
MILDLPSTSSGTVSKELVRLRNAVGAMAMGRVLTLLVSVDEGRADAAIKAANDATRQHPARILVLVSSNSRGAERLDAQIRVGGDAGASEIVVLRLYGELTRQEAAVVTPLLLPDSPIVVWWPAEAPADVADSPLGRMAHRRITDAAAGARPTTQLRRRASSYQAGDTDLAWTRITRWRALLAAALEDAPFEPVDWVTVSAEAQDPGADLLAGWLAASLNTPVTRVRSAAGTGLVSVRLERASGPVDLVRTEDRGDTATLSRVGSPPRLVALHTPSLAGALGEELRRLDADEIYASSLCDGLTRVRRGGTRSAAARAGDVPAGPAEIDPAAREAVASDALPETPTDRASSEEVREEVEVRLSLAQHDQVRVHADRDSLARAVVDALVERVEGAVGARGVAHVVLTGGSAGTATATELVARSRAGELDARVWRQVHLWWGDERFVPAHDSDRNDAQADAAGLTDLPVLKKHVHRVPSGSAPARLGEAAARYAAELATWAEAPHGVPEFDVVMLGMGPDAHVASLFPGRPELALREPTTAAVPDSPKPPPLRVTLTLPSINAARAVWLVVSGKDKAEAVAAALEATEDPSLPASCVHGQHETLWWVDAAAAARIGD